MSMAMPAIPDKIIYIRSLDDGTVSIHMTGCLYSEILPLESNPTGFLAYAVSSLGYAYVVKNADIPPVVVTTDS